MELVGEHEVPVRRCSDIIKTVSRSFFNVHFNDSALPSKTSNLRFADQAHGIARLHISEALSQKRFDFHVDGTSKNTKTFEGMQATLEDKTTLSLGFDPVAIETAQTVLDLAL